MTTAGPGDAPLPPAAASAGTTPLSRTALRALRLKPAPGQPPASQVWSHRRRAYISLFDPTACVPMAPPRALTDLQRAALALGRQHQTHEECIGCRVSIPKRALSRDRICASCRADWHAELADQASAERHDRRMREWETLFAPTARGTKTLYLDIETTGLGALDEPLEIGVVDEAGTAILHSFVRPICHTAWPDAQAVHGISPSDVRSAPALHQLAPQLAEVLDGAGLVVAYNAPFDLVYLPAAVRPQVEPKMRCAMQAYAVWVGEWSNYHGGWRLARLVDAAAAAEFAWPSMPHRALADAQAVRAVWRWLRDRQPRGTDVLAP